MAELSRVLAGLKCLWPAPGIGGRSIAGSENLGHGMNSEGSIDEDPGERIPTGRHHHGVGNEDAVVSEAYTVCHRGSHGCAETNRSHAIALQFRKMGTRRKLRREAERPAIWGRGDIRARHAESPAIITISP